MAVGLKQRSSVQAEAQRILIIGDYGKGTPNPEGNNDLAFFEVMQEFKALYPAGQIDFVSVPAFDSRRTAEVAYEAANSGKYDLVFHNTAPRKDEKKARVENAGEVLAYTRTQAGDKAVTVVGVASGDDSHNTFSLFKENGNDVYAIDVERVTGKVNTQFRSRDVFPAATKEVTDFLSKNTQGHPDFCRKVTGQIPLMADRTEAVNPLAGVNGYGKIHPQQSEQGEYITLITPQDTAQERRDKIAERATHSEIDVLAIHSGEDAWLEAGFALQQLALSEAAGRIPNRAFGVYLNAPSAQDSAYTYQVKLDNGVKVLTDDIHALQLVAPHVKEVTSYRGYPVPEVQMWDQPQLEAFRTEALDALEEKKFSVAYADGYGNLKLVITHGELLEHLQKELKEKGVLNNEIPENKGIEADVSFRAADGQEYQLQARVTGESFGVADGEVALSQGSSGHGETHHVEVFLRGGNAQAALGNILPGQTVDISNIRLVDKPLGQKPGTTVSPEGETRRLGQQQNRAAGL